MSDVEKKYFSEITKSYHDELLNEVMPFWFPRSVDEKYGGFINSLDQDGTILQDDKYVWFQGRSVWTLCTLYHSVQKNERWLAFAEFGMDFINRYCFDENHRAWFSTTRDGRPLSRQNNIFSDIYIILAMAAYTLATGDAAMGGRASELFQEIVQDRDRITGLESVRPIRTLAVPMVLIVTAQELRKVDNRPWLTTVIDNAIDEIERYLLKEEFACVLEMTGPHGELIDSFDGRTVCPGHSFETSWFILEEARLRNNDPRLIRLGTTILDWTFEKAWDQRFGGLFQLMDCKQRSCSEHSHDMKLWWPHTEAIIASLLAWTLTFAPKYAQWHKILHDWSYAHFHDPQYGEWFGYLHRDGSPSTKLKGNIWKGPFHLPRMLWFCRQRIQELE